MGLQIRVTDTATMSLDVIRKLVQNKLFSIGKEEVENIVKDAQKNLDDAKSAYTTKYPRKGSPGKLRANIFSDAQNLGNGLNYVFMVYVDEDKVPYAKFVEWPHQSFPGYYFMTLAFEDAQRDIEKRISTKLIASLSSISI